MKLVIRVLLLIFLFGTVFLNKSYANNFEKAEAYLKNANTYYWYGRYKENSLYEFEQSKLYCDSTIYIVGNYKGNNPIIIKRKNEIILEVENLLETIRNVSIICIDNMNGRYPIFMELMGRCDDYEYYDDATELAMESSIDKLLKIPYPSKPLGNQMFKSVIILNKDDGNLYEIAQQYTNINTSHYMLGAHEVPGITDFRSVDNKLLLDSILPELCIRHSIEKVGVFNLKKVDQINGINYWSTDFMYFDLTTNSYKGKITAESFKNDKMETIIKSSIYILKYILVDFLLFVFFVYVIIIYRKENRRITELIHSSAYFIGSFIISVILVNLFMVGIESITLSSSSFYGEPMNKYVWHLLLIPLSFSILPVFITYTIFARFFNVKLFKWYNIFSIMLGTQLVWPLILAKNIYTKYNVFPDEYLYLLIISTIIIYLVSILLGWNIYRLRNETKNKYVKTHIFSTILLAVLLYFIPYIEVQKMSLIYGSALIYIYPVFLLGTILSTLFILKSKKNSSKEVKQSSTSYKKGKFDFNKWISEESKYVSANTIKPNNDFLTNLFNESSHFINIISGPSGIGKTRFVNELIKVCDKEHKDNKTFYGDCDQYVETTQIPYEPFAQALGDEIDIDYNSKEHAFANNFGKLLSSLDVGPSKAIGDLLDNSDVIAAANTDELATEIFKYLKSKSNKTNKLLFVLDDAQWMDDLTYSLLSKIIKLIKKNSIDNIIFIITFRAEEEIISDTIFKNFERLNFDNKDDVLDDIKTAKNHTEEKYILYPDSFIKSFIYNLNNDKKSFGFDSNTADKLMNFFQNINLDEHKNPSYYIQILKNIYLNKWFIIDYDNRIIKLSDNANLNEIPSPTELSDLYNEIFNKLPKQTLEALECAAFIGMKFKANILAKVLNLDRINLLQRLSHAEEVGLIKDVRPEDDYFIFSEKILLQEIKKRVDIDDSAKKPGQVTQLVKEYHIQIIKFYLQEITSSNIVDIDNNETDLESSNKFKIEFLKSDKIDILLSLSNHSLIVFDRIPSDAVEITRAVIKKVLILKRSELAISLYKNLLKTIKSNIYADLNKNFAHKQIFVESKKMSVLEVHQFISFELIELMIRLSRDEDEIEIIIENAKKIQANFIEDISKFELETLYFSHYNEYLKIDKDNEKYKDLEIEIKSIEEKIKDDNILILKFLFLRYRCLTQYRITNYEINVKSEETKKEKTLRRKIEEKENSQNLLRELNNELEFFNSTELNYFFIESNYRKGQFYNLNDKIEGLKYYNKIFEELTNNNQFNFLSIVERFSDYNLDIIGMALDYSIKNSWELEKYNIALDLFEYLSKYRSIVKLYKTALKDENKIDNDTKLAMINNLKKILLYYTELDDIKDMDTIDLLNAFKEIVKYDNQFLNDVRIPIVDFVIKQNKITKYEDLVNKLHETANDDIKTEIIELFKNELYKTTEDKIKNQICTLFPELEDCGNK